MKVFVVDLEKCNGCYGCQIACKDETVGNEWLPYSMPQPDTGQFWAKVVQKDHGQVPKVRVEYRPTFCNHCENCSLVDMGAAYRREDGLVILDPEKATDKALVEACPYHAVFWNEELAIAQKCTGCAHLVDEGKLPHCVDACATNALFFGEEEDFADKIANAVDDFDIEGTNPRVKYINPMRLFISGEVWDPSQDEIIHGALVTLTDAAGEKQQVKTDCYGDFWFKRLKPGAYVIDIEAEGFKGIEGKVVELEKSLNIGDFPLAK